MCDINSVKDYHPCPVTLMDLGTSTDGDYCTGIATLRTVAASDPGDTFSEVWRKSGILDGGVQNLTLKLEERQNAPSREKNNIKKSISDDPCFSKIAGTIKLGFISANRSAQLNNNHMATLKQAILKTLIAFPTPGLKPQFERCVSRNDWLLLICNNNNAADWVRKNFSHIKAACALQIDLLEESEFPIEHLVEGYFPDSRDISNKKVLSYLGAQNNLITKSWNVVMREVRNGQLHLTFMVDENSWKTLLKCSGKVWYCFGKIKLHVKNTLKDAEEAGKKLGNRPTKVHAHTSEVTSDKQGTTTAAPMICGPSTSSPNASKAATVVDFTPSTTPTPQRKRTNNMKNYLHLLKNQKFECNKCKLSVGTYKHYHEHLLIHNMNQNPLDEQSNDALVHFGSIQQSL